MLSSGPWYVNFVEIFWQCGRRPEYCEILSISHLLSSKTFCDDYEVNRIVFVCFEEICFIGWNFDA